MINREHMLILQLKHRLALEMKGIRFRGVTAYSLAKSRLGLKGSRKQVYEQLCTLWEEIVK
jgi:hypothetical protein